MIKITPENVAELAKKDKLCGCGSKDDAHQKAVEMMLSLMQGGCLTFTNQVATAFSAVMYMVNEKLTQGQIDVENAGDAFAEIMGDTCFSEKANQRVDFMIQTAMEARQTKAMEQFAPPTVKEAMAKKNYLN